MLKGQQDEPYPILSTLSTNILNEPYLKMWQIVLITDPASC